MKVLINSCYGGFGFSKDAIDIYKKRGGTLEPIEYWFGDDVIRTDPIMLSVVKELEYQAYGPFAALEIKTIPDEYDYRIEEYDGYENIVLYVREDHLRKLIQNGNEDEIVKYVMGARCDGTEDEAEDDESCE